MSGFDDMTIQAAEAGEALAALEAPARAAARSIEDAFSAAGTSLARSLARAAADGEVSLAELARAVLAAVRAAAGGSSGGGGGLGEALGSALTSAFSGARADGGAVTGGGAYLVGERGPEVFRPAGAGTVEPLGGAGMSVTVQVSGGDVGGLARSDAQLAQALARAVSLGARRL